MWWDYMNIHKLSCIGQPDKVDLTLIKKRCWQQPYRSRVDRCGLFKCLWPGYSYAQNLYRKDNEPELYSSAIAEQILKNRWDQLTLLHDRYEQIGKYSCAVVLQG